MKNSEELMKWKLYVDKNKELIKVAKQLKHLKRPFV